MDKQDMQASVEEPLGAFEELKLRIESVLFSAESPLDAAEIRNLLDSTSSLSEIKLALKDLSKDYKFRSFEMLNTQEKFCLRTKEKYTPLVYKQYQNKARSLTKNALETLAIVAYKQPVTRAEINAIRQVDSSAIMSTLKEKGLISVAGIRKELGHPMEYKTTAKFLEVFGLQSLKDLPALRSLQPTTESSDQIRTALSEISGLELSPPEEMGESV